MFKIVTFLFLMQCRDGGNGHSEIKRQFSQTASVIARPVVHQVSRLFLNKFVYCFIFTKSKCQTFLKKKFAVKITILWSHWYSV